MESEDDERKRKVGKEGEEDEQEEGKKDIM